MKKTCVQVVLDKWLPLISSPAPERCGGRWARTLKPLTKNRFREEKIIKAYAEKTGEKVRPAKKDGQKGQARN